MLEWVWNLRRIPGFDSGGETTSLQEPEIETDGRYHGAQRCEEGTCDLCCSSRRAGLPVRVVSYAVKVLANPLTTYRWRWEDSRRIKKLRDTAEIKDRDECERDS